MPIADDWTINYNTKQIYHTNWKDEIAGSSASVAEIQVITPVAVSGNITTGDFFTVYSAKDVTPYYVWFNVASGGGDPTPTGFTEIEVAVGGSDTAQQVSDAIVSAINTTAGTDFTAANTGGTVVPVTLTNDNVGSCTNAATDTGLTGFTYAVTTHGIGETVYTVNALYSYLQDTFDELGQMDDTVPMSAQTPTDYTLINEWFIDEVSIKYLYGGAIQTNGWNWVQDTTAGIVQVEYASGSPVASDIGLPVVLETDGDSGTTLFIDTTRKKIWIRPDDSTLGNSFDSTAGYNVDFTGGTQNIPLTASAGLSGENLWANVYTLGTIESTPYPQIYIFQNGSSITEWSTLTNWDRGQIDILINVKEMGTEIDGAQITVFARQGNDSYDHFAIDLTSGGRNAVPLSTAADLNYTTGDYYLLYDTEVGGPFSANEIIKANDDSWQAEVVSITDWGTTGLFKLTNVTGTVSDNSAFTGQSSLATGQSNGTLGDTYFAYTESTGFSTLGQTLTQATSGTKRILRGYQDDGATGKAVSQIDTTVTGNSRDVYYQAFNATNAVTGSTDGNVTPSAISTTIVSGWNDITVAFVNGTLTYSATSGALTAGEAVTQATSGATGIFLYQTTTTGAGTATIGNVVGTFDNTNVITGAISGATLTSSSTLSSAHTMTKAFTQQTAYPYDVIINAGDIYYAGRTMSQVYEYLKFITQQDSTFQMYTVVSGTITPLDGEEYIQAYTGYTPVKSAPFGTFAGGKFFGAQGVWVEGLASGQSYQFIDSNGTVREPYASITIQVTSIVSGDRVTVFRTSGGSVDKNLYQSHASNNAAGDTTIETDGDPDISTDTPDSGIIRVVDASENTEHRFRYSSWTQNSNPTPDVFTLVTGLPSGTADSDEVTGTYFIDSGADFSSVLPGDLVRNETDGSWAHVITVNDSTDTITHTPLQGGTNNDWETGDTYSFNNLPVTYTASDTLYVPFLDETATTTSSSVTVLYASNRDVLIRVRKKGILPFETSGSVTSSGLSVAAIRTTDSIVT